MSGVTVLQHFEAYQKARVSFVQAVAEAATRPQNIEVLQNAGVMQLLRPLLLDNVSWAKIHDHHKSTNEEIGCGPLYPPPPA